MKELCLRIGLLLISGVLICVSCTAPPVVSRADYLRAESYLQPNISKKVYHVHVQPHWLSDTTQFWHVTNTREGKRFFLTCIQAQTTEVAFDHEVLAEHLAEETGSEVDPADLPFDRIHFKEQEVIVFRVDEDRWQYHLETQTLSRAEETKPTPPGVSPDGQWQAFIRDYNLFVRNLKTGAERRLSSRGKPGLEYANTYGWGDLMEGEDGERPENLFVNWSPDSRRLLTYLVDLRQAEKMYLLDFSIDTLFRPKLLSYYRGSPGDTTLVYNIAVLFDLDTGRETAIELPPIPHFIGVPFSWTADSRQLYAVFAHRGFKQADVIRVEAATGQVEVLLSEKSETSVEYGKLVLQRIGEDKLLVSSERDGWHHLYLHDRASGTLLNPVTQGDYVVKQLLHVDEEEGVLYFTAGGREAGRNPYHDHVYRVHLDGSGLQLLTPENAHHVVNLSPCKRYFVDNFSRPDLPTTSVVRRLQDGELLFPVSRADVSDLEAEGWQPPLPFQVKARDGITDIYGVIYLPYAFNSRKRYPLIDYSYTGPHTSIAPKAFRDALYNISLPLTAFGFAVVVVDGMGTAHRSRAFREVSYRNMGYNLACHVAAIRQLAERHHWLDTTRIGIYGHSAGGYDAARGMLIYPDFYQVGVASAADHDHRMEKAWWPEMYMGYPVGDYYHEQSNVTQAHKLQGRLLIAHGAIDENVNPSATYKMAEYLIRAGKDFDMLILPGLSHSFGRSDGDYFTKVRWNYFIQHLLGAEPILHYQFDTIP